MMVDNTVLQGQGVALGVDNANSGTAGSALFNGHPNGSVVHGVGIAITWVEEVKRFFSEIKPVILIEVSGSIAAENFLKLMLERR